MVYLKIACSLQCIPVPITSQCPPCNCECWGCFFVESYFLTLLFLCPGLSYPYANSQHNHEAQGEQLGWGKKWEIIQLLSLPKQTHCVPAPSAHGSQALKKRKEKKEKRNKENSHDTEDVSCTVQHVVKDNYPQSGPVVRFLHAEPLA